MLQVIKPYQFYSKKFIEQSAMAFIDRTNAQRKRPLTWPIDAGNIAECLGLDIDFGYIPPDDGGIVAAMIWPLDRKILINEKCLDFPKGFENSSIAHEIGHWGLHVNHKNIAYYEKLKEAGHELIPQLFLCRNPNSTRGIEWQAQYFASCLLMPQPVLKQVCQGRDLMKWTHLYAMKDEIGVTISHLVYRLTDLGLIYVQEDSKKIYPGKMNPKKSLPQPLNS